MAVGEEASPVHEQRGHALLAQEERLAGLLGVWQRIAVPETSEEVLDEIVRGAVEAVPGTDRAGVSLRERGGAIRTVASSDSLVAAIDAAQAELREGPCVDAIEAEPVVSVPDVLEQSSRWPRFVPHARRLGLAATLSFRLSADRGTVAALNLHSATPHAFEDEARGIGELFAAHAALALARTDRTENLNRALASRDVIGQAKGILIQRHRVSADKAFAMLVGASQDTNVKLVDVAHWLVQETTAAE